MREPSIEQNETSDNWTLSDEDIIVDRDTNVVNAEAAKNGQNQQNYQNN
jgi:hypothetical protein